MAATSDVLTAMQDIDDVISSLDVVGTSGANQDRAVRAANYAQDLLEQIIAKHEGLLASVDDSVTQTAAQEYSSTPARLLRLDALWFLDPSTSLPLYEIDAERTPGGHRGARSWPLFDVSTNTAGRPERYWWARGEARVYWDRQPDTTNGIRFIGFFGAAAMTISPDSTFAYEDALILPVAQVAAETFWFRRRDDWTELRRFAQEYFTPVVEQMMRDWRHQREDMRGVYPAW